MQAITNAQSTVGRVQEERLALQAALAAPGMPAPAMETLGSIATTLDGVVEDMTVAVADLAAGDAVNSKDARTESVARARGRLKRAEETKQQLAKDIAEASRAFVDKPGASAVLGAASRVLAGVGQAAAATDVAVRQSEQRGNRLSRRVRHAGWIVGIAIAGFIGFRFYASPERDLLWASAFAWAVVGITLLFVTWRDPDNGVFGPIIGSDKRFSTSRTQIALWTIAVGFAVAYLTGLVVFGGKEIEQLLPNERLGEYLLLLGGPFSAAILAKLAVASKVDDGTIQKTEAIEPKPSQILEDDTGTVDLVDSQYFMFNLIALGYFVVQFAQKAELPTMPDVLLGLTSAAAATYTANKAAEKNAPQITSISPRTVRPGDRIRIAGLNFVAGVEDTDPARVAVFIEGVAGEVRPIPGLSSSAELVVDLPISVGAGSKAVSVRTAANVTSGSQIIEVLGNAPVLLGMKTKAEVGKNVVAIGRNLRTPGATADPELVSVSVGNYSVVGRATDEDLAFEIPDNVAKDTDLAITISRAGVTSAPITIHTAR